MVTWTLFQERNYDDNLLSAVVKPILRTITFKLNLKKGVIFWKKSRVKEIYTVEFTRQDRLIF